MGYFAVCIMIAINILLLIVWCFGKKIAKKKKFSVKYKSMLFYDGADENEKARKNIFVYVMVGVMLTILILVCKINYHFQEYVKVFLVEINSIESIIISFYGIIITSIIFSITLRNREHYLNVTVEEINKHYFIDALFQISGIAAVMSIICTLMLQDNNLNQVLDYICILVYEMSCIVIIIVGTYVLHIVGLLGVGSKRMELYALDNLYTIFWSNSALKLVKRTEDVIYENLRYLIAKYCGLEVVRDKELYNIKSIAYVEDISADEEMCKFSVKVLIVFEVLLSVISIVFPLYIKRINLFLILVVLLGLDIILLRISWVRKGITNMILGINGFVINMGEKKKVIGAVSFYYNLFLRKYVCSINNMMAMYCILCYCWGEEGYCVIRQSLVDMIEYIREKEYKRNRYETALLYLPIFVCAHFYHEVCENDFPKEVVELYKSFGLKDKEKANYKLTVNSFIWSAHRYRPSKKDMEEIKGRKISIKYYEKYIENSGYWKRFE